jgi:hypothetical protein
VVRALIGEDGGPDKARKGKIRCPFHRFRSVSRRAINNRHRFLGYPPPWPSPTSAFARRRLRRDKRGGGNAPLSRREPVSFIMR